MTTILAKVLQKPSIIEIEGSSIKIAHPNIDNYANTSLSAQLALGATTIYLKDNMGFVNDDWFVVGEIGDNRTEECDVNGAVTRGETMTITNTLKFNHEIDAPVNKVYERGVKIYGASTDGGDGTLLASVDAVIAPIADAVEIQWSRLFTQYVMPSTDTAYAYYFVKFTDGTTDSVASNYIPSTGWKSDRAIKIIESATELTNTTLSSKNISLAQAVKWCNEAQDSVMQFKLQDPQTGLIRAVSWDFETIEDTSISLSSGENEYDLSDLTYTPKFTDSDKSFISVWVGSKNRLERKTIQEIDEVYAEKVKTYLSVEAVAGDVSITVDSNVEYDSTGTLYIGGDEITYTGKTGTTIFTGIPASGTGAIIETHVVDLPVWQNIEPELPSSYAIFNSKIYLDCPIDSDYSGFPLKIKMFRKLNAITELSDETDISFSNILHLFIASRIERKKGNEDKATLYMTEFNQKILDNAIGNIVPTTDQSTYYEFINP